MNMRRNETIPILEKFGFIEQTNVHYPEHWVKFKKSGESDKVKRCFKYKRCYILFDYESIHIHNNSDYFDSIGSDLPMNQLQSLLYFLLCSSQRKTYYKNNWVSMLNLEGFFENQLQYMDIMRKKYLQTYLFEFESFKEIKQKYFY